MPRFIPWRIIYIYGAISICAISAVYVGSLFLGTSNFERIVSSWAIAILLTGVCVCFTAAAFLTPPDYVTEQQVQVWSDVRERSFVLPTSMDLENFLNLFCEKTLEVVKTAPNLATSERLITRDQLKKMLCGAKILFTRDELSLNGLEWKVRDEGCSQRGKLMAVKYCSPFTPSNLSQALWHTVNADVLKRDPDPTHANLPWWLALERVQERVEADLYRADWLAQAAQIVS